MLSVGLGVEEELLYKFTALCKCKIGALPLSYLGIPLRAYLRRISIWDAIVEKFKKKFLGWKSRSLSFAASIMHINYVLYSLPIFFMSLFKAPVIVIKRIDKIRRNILWR